MIVLDNHHILCLTHPEAVVDHMTEPEVFRHPHQTGSGPQTALLCRANLPIDLVEVAAVVTEHLIGH